MKLVCMVGGTDQQEQEESLLAPTKLGVLVVGTPGDCARRCVLTLVERRKAMTGWGNL